MFPWYDSSDTNTVSLRLLQPSLLEKWVLERKMRALVKKKIIQEYGLKPSSKIFEKLIFVANWSYSHHPIRVMICQNLN